MFPGRQLEDVVWRREAVLLHEGLHVVLAGRQRREPNAAVVSRHRRATVLATTHRHQRTLRHISLIIQSLNRPLLEYRSPKLSCLLIFE